ncbi:MAG: hypothetical protein NUW37_07185 [Planctomycetes bacterium]|nr:hypothetical protein [Planctomycetota bacterium]
MRNRNGTGEKVLIKTGALLSLCASILFVTSITVSGQTEDERPNRTQREETAANAQNDSRFPPDGFPRPRGYSLQTLDAVDKGMRYIAAHQNANGSFGSAHTVATTSLCGLSLLSSGSSLGRGEFGEAIYRTLDFLVRRQTPNLGYITEESDASNSSNIHGHGLALLFLAQVYATGGVTRVADRDISQVMSSAVRLIVDHQTPKGGWNYVPNASNFDEASTTICVIQGLRAAQDVGIAVPRETIDNAQKYINESRQVYTWNDKATGDARQGYTFKYSLAMNISRPSFPLAAGAVATLQMAGDYYADTVRGGLDFLEAYYTGSMAGALPEENWYTRFFYYSHFYAAQAFYHAPNRNYWTKYWAFIENKLMSPEYKSDGPTWKASEFNHQDEFYCTAIATLILQIPRGTLPIFQK